MTSITYHPDSRNEVLHDLSCLHINGEYVHKLESLGTIYVNHRKRVNVFRRFNSVYEILFETDDHTIHFHKNVRIMDSLYQLFGSDMDYLDVMEVFSYKHHGALITHEAFHLPTLYWNELHYTWGGVSMYLESRPQAQEQQEQQEQEQQEQEQEQQEQEQEQQEQWASPLVCHELYESESESEAEEASLPEIPTTPAKRRCLSDRFTALLQKRTFSETESEESEESDSEDSESQEDCCTVLRSGMKYPRNLY